MTAEGDPLERRTAPSEVHADAVAPVVPSPGAVLCYYDGSAASRQRLRFAAEAAVTGGRRLVVAHVEKPSSGFWAAAFTGYGACLGPPEQLFSTSSEAAFADVVEALIDIPAGWDFAAMRMGRLRALRELSAAHGVAVVILGGNRRMSRRLARNPDLTVLTV